MSDKEVFLIYSDLHLENHNYETKKSFVFCVNEKIKELKNKDLIPIVLLAGDIDNGDNAYSYINEIESQVFYVAGNHEYWEQDFTNTQDKLLENTPKNTKFLNNNIAITNENIVLGTTLWTDAGQSLNPDITVFCSNIMNDNIKIKNSGWYNKENIEKLQEFQSSNFKEEAVEESNWNLMMQLEENKYSINYIKIFNEFHSFYIKKIEPFFLKNEKSKKQSLYNLLSDIDFVNELTKDCFFDKKLILKFKNCASSNQIYNKFKESSSATNLIKDKKIVLMSHHGLMYEELLVGRKDYLFKQEKQSPINDINEDLFLINKGFEYPGENYLYRCAKQEFKFEKSLPKILQYYNNFSSHFDGSFFEKISLLVHGHNHHHNFYDFIKSCQIVTNTAGYFIKKNSIAKDEIHKEIMPISKKFNDDIENLATCWTFYLFDKNKYENVLEEAKQEITSLGKDVVIQFHSKEEHVYNLKMKFRAIKTILDEIDEVEKNLNKAISLRIDPSYTFAKQRYNHKNLNNGFYHFSDKMEHEKYKYIFDNIKNINNYDYQNENTLKEILSNLFHIGFLITYKQKKIQNVKEIFKDKKFNTINDITKKEVDNFIDLGDISYEVNFQTLEKNIESKIHKLTKQLTVLSLVKSVKIN